MDRRDHEGFLCRLLTFSPNEVKTTPSQKDEKYDGKDNVYLAFQTCFPCWGSSSSPEDPFSPSPADYDC
jgi:hypothetical protein